MNLDFKSLGFTPDEYQLPNYIAVEGAIGVGKTTLARNLATTFEYETLLEMPEDNPFLQRFYADPKTNALPAQLHFLFQRTRQLEEIKQRDMFHPVRVADFLLEKDPIFAQVTLDDDELRLYQMVYEQLTLDAPKPDLVIYLQAPTEVLQRRIRQRGINSERYIEPDYLARLNDAYATYFHFYDASPLLIVNAAEVNFATNQDHYADLVRYMLNVKSGTHYYNPLAKN